MWVPRKTPKHPSQWTILLLKQPCMVTWGPHSTKKHRFFGSCSAAATGDSWAQKLHHTLQDVLLQREEH